MSKIKVMSENLANKIAAGEVVERISSVVKECVENSIDAHAQNIKVELWDAGKKKIRITDDGIGMDKNDAINAFKRHATSKLYKDDDLFFINTLGFRGEALPSIAAVSDVLLETYDGTEGTSVHIKGGETLDVGVAPSRQGTVLTISNLFYNTPARLKYLKSEPSELSNVSQYLERLALSYPKVSVVLLNNGSIVMRTTGSGDLLKTIHEIYGKDVSSNMLAIKGSNDDYDVSGYVSKPIVQRSTRNFMTTIINGRVIKNLELNKIINDAYYTYKPDSTYPIVVISIETDPTLIDVNIHPTKQDIKFSKMGELRDVLTKAIKDALYETMLIPDALYFEKGKNNEESTDDDLLESLPSALFVKENEETSIETMVQLSDDSSDHINPLYKDDVPIEATQKKFEFSDGKNVEVKALELHPVGIALGTYIIAENEDGVFLIDQHAAVERINYEKVLAGLLTNDNVSMIIPMQIELSGSDIAEIKNHLHVLSNMGFDVEEFGINTLRINAHPIWIKKGKELETTRTIIDLVIEAHGDFDPIKFNDKVAATIACKKSLKGNTRITLDLAAIILKELVLCDNPYNCPHGRPTIIKFTTYELEKMFKRVM